MKYMCLKIFILIYMTIKHYNMLNDTKIINKINVIFFIQHKINLKRYN